MTKSEKRQEWERAAQLMHKLPQATSEQIGELMTLAARLNRYNETACNYGLSEQQEKRVTNLEKRVRVLCTELGISAHFNGDPRGYAVRLALPDGSYNTWGGKEEGWGI